MTSFCALSMICMSKGLLGPQHCLVQQSVSSAAKYICWPIAFFTLYLFAVSNPVKAIKLKKIRWTNYDEIIMKKNFNLIQLMHDK